MKRMYKPVGSPTYPRTQRKKFVGHVQQQSRNKFYGQRRGNAYSVFQTSSGIEKKNIDDQTSKWTTGVTTWVINALNDVAQGVTAQTRIGRKILMKSLLVQGYITVTGSPAIPRIVIVYDRQANGALPAATDIFTSNTVMAAMNLDNRDRFLVVADIFPGDDSENLTGNSAGNFGYKRFIKMNLETIYSGNAGTIADITSGSLLICTNLNGGTLSNETGIQRIRFVDE